ncbi:hypothetical protein COCON_G00228590 [Conger conger]|uniref:NADH dehydrogenase [ubiquinone] 1 alpha subcomplex subunit 5 n=1 Tax=Conger conger TaxID=82655 RepID=A0A9Q1CV19_CONCO|nr:hypothetical protein COCON_G00228590 [Conger conger]
MAGLLKKTTGLVGLAVSQNPHERLRVLYSKILASVQKMPQDAAYRKYTEEIVNERMNHVRTESDVQKLEQKINCGQIEEVISQAESELFLSRKMLEWKPWEPLVYGLGLGFVSSLHGSLVWNRCWCGPHGAGSCGSVRRGGVYVLFPGFWQCWVVGELGRTVVAGQDVCQDGVLKCGLCVGAVHFFLLSAVLRVEPRIVWLLWCTVLLLDRSPPKGSSAEGGWLEAGCSPGGCGGSKPSRVGGGLATGEELSRAVGSTGPGRGQRMEADSSSLSTPSSATQSLPHRCRCAPRPPHIPPAQSANHSLPLPPSAPQCAWPITGPSGLITQEMRNTWTQNTLSESVALTSVWANSSSSLNVLVN